MADFVEVMKIEKRLCESTKKCEECVLNHNNNGKNTICGSLATDYPEEAQEILLKWAEEHPIVTNRDKFREVFGLAEEEFNPTNGCSYIKCLCRKCDECPRKNFWFNEYKEPEVREKG